ncbi:MAG: Heme-binding protein [Pedosphaera sp.]|nr:Heme-binding protein [Pedosphaera sp.]
MKPTHLYHTVRVSLLTLLLLATGLMVTQGAEPIRALLITGGCCHDFEAQKKILTEGISARANVTWTIVHEGGDTRDYMVSVYQKPDWTKGYDVVVHDECFGYVTNVAFVEQITQAHSNGIPAVTLHCSTHSYRMSTTDEWRKLLGVSSYQHEKRRSFEVFNLKPEHPIMKGFPAQWHDTEDELYEIKKLWPDCVPLGKGVGETKAEHVCIWANTYGKARVFGTSLGHGNDTVKDAVYLDLVSRGLLWACNKLDENGKPLAGYGGK